MDFKVIERDEGAKVEGDHDRARLQEGSVVGGTLGAKLSRAGALLASHPLPHSDDSSPVSRWVDGMTGAHTLHRSGPARDEFVSVQYLRGFAALIVVYFHIFLNKIVSPYELLSGAGLWGVDIFFVISGFIMWTSTSSTSPAGFLTRRFWRIFPLYWICLTAWIVSRLIIPDHLHNADVDAYSVFFSYWLIPHYNLVYKGMVWPILTVGWSLQLELFFYAVFAGALCIAQARTRLVVVVAALVALSVVGMCAAPEQAAAKAYTSPLLLEFAAGMLLSANVGRLRALPWWVSAGLIATGTSGALSFYALAAVEVLRPLVLGIPALLVVAGTLALEDRLRRAPSKTWRLIGDASYSLYLTHPLSISAVAVFWQRIGLPVGGTVAALWFVPLAALASIGVAILCYRALERPITSLSRRRRPRLADAAPSSRDLVADAL